MSFLPFLAESRKITLVTDHKSLPTKNAPASMVQLDRVFRQKAFLAETGVDFEWCKGALQFVDVMTRPAETSVTWDTSVKQGLQIVASVVSTRSGTRRTLSERTLLSQHDRDENSLRRLLEECNQDLTLEEIPLEVRESAHLFEKLWIVKCPKSGKDVLYVPKPGLQMLVSLHTHAKLSSHVALASSITATRRYYYWPSLEKDIEAIVRSCLVCKVVNQPGVSSYEIGEIPRGSRPLEMIFFDWLYMGKESLSGNAYMFVVLCTFCSACALFPSANMTGASAAKFLLEWIRWYGDPCEYFSDVGPSMIEAAVKELARVKSTMHNFSTPNVSHTNGLGENAMKKVKKMYTAVLLENKVPGNQWDNWAGVVQYSLLTIPVGKNDLSAFQLLFGMDIRTPVHILFQEHAKKRRVIKVVDWTTNELEHLRTTAASFRFGEQLISAERQGKHAERVARSVTGGISLPLELSSYVLLASGEKTYRWDCMAQVVDRETNWVYKVELVGSKTVRMVHIQNLRPCYASNYELSLDDGETLAFLELERTGIAGVEEFRIGPKGLEAYVIYGTVTRPKAWVLVTKLQREVPLLLAKTLTTTLCAEVAVKNALEQALA
jgi:hypothetical protein